ncbi:hypothetical protein EDC94DRAFT_655412 [Helicostylum pulchrum]|uniref:Yeast cell wall synthesis Kre9/Knh1-like N-terminal domain-containing protein n=1 Tax=Helicostylum pulchrum TaxID=562976 RepID=A0ABP9XS05_9FUNG|nr:hypothetical protein EDC94DRAFT_655412 [Helicostylum pulchrum]
MFLTKVLIASFCAYVVVADMAPNYPEPGTIWKSGTEYEISWFDDKKAPSISKAWTNFKIDFMTGDNNNQRFLKNVARDLDASQLDSINWTAPVVKPHSAIYFLMFTNEKGDNAWTTRFAITDEEEKLTKPQHAAQPDGAKIPWGVGRMVSDAKGFPLSNVAYSMTPAMASAAERNAAVEIAVSNNSNQKMKLSFSILLLSAAASLLNL